MRHKGPARLWDIEAELQPSSLELGPQPFDVGRTIHEVREFGDTLISFDPNNTRTLEVFSSSDGVTFWASAEDVGSATLRQSQRFIKRAPDATLEFVITAGVLQAVDFNQFAGTNECPLGFDVAVCHPIVAQIFFEAEAVTPLGELLADATGAPALHTGGSLALRGQTTQWQFVPSASALHTTTPFSLGNFVTSLGNLNRNPKATLLNDIVLRIDLSQVEVGEEFLVRSKVIARAVNGRGRESG
ncbi:MAG: hypothetical protein H7Z19_12545, partial [Chitinophagaceae bacterium]|nr:hypothetical protein [Rubrivivax sp.]